VRSISCCSFLRSSLKIALLFQFALLSVGQRTVAQVTVVPSISTVAGGGTGGTIGDGGAATSAKLRSPFGVALDSAGNIYIADQANQRIRKVDTSGNISTVAGNGTAGYSGDGGAATSTELNWPAGVAVDSAGNIYIADSYNSRIRKVDTSGNISTVAGNGIQGYNSSSVATSAELNQPYGVAVDSTGNIYIADANNHRIRKVDTSGNISTVAGNGTPGYSGDNGLAISAELSAPIAVTLDSAGNIYFAEQGNFCIRKVDASTGNINTIAGNGTQGYNGDGILATLAELDYPDGMAVDSAGNIYISDQGNQRIRKVDASTGYISTVAGDGTSGYSGDGDAAISAELNHPTGVAVDSAGNIYIADNANSLIRKVAPAAIQFAATAIGSSTAKNVVLQLTSALNITGIAAPQSQGGKQEYAVGTVSGCTVDATGLTSTASGTICTVPVTFTPGYSGPRPVPLQVSTLSGSTTTVYAVGLNGIGTGPQVALTPGTINTVAGNGTPGYSGDGGAATSAELYNPGGVAVDSAGNIYIVDSYNQRIRKVDTSGNISTVAGNGTPGYSGDGGAATSAELYDPTGAAVDSAGNIYITDYFNNRIRKVDTSGKISTVAGTGAHGYSGDNGLATSAELYLPSYVAVDSAGNIYVADEGNNRIRKVDVSTGYISTVAGNGTKGYSGDNGLATSAELSNPMGAAVDSAGNIYIADIGNNRIRKVNVSTGCITTVAGTGAQGYSGDNGLATSAELHSPAGVAVDSAVNIYIADTYNQRIRKVDASTGNISTVAGNGTGGFSGDGSAATSAEINYPWGLTVDSTGNIYIADTSNNSIRKVDVSASSLGFATATNVGLTDTTDDPQTATISNIGNSALTFSIPGSGYNPSIAANFTLNSSGVSACPLLTTGSSAAGTLASGASCTLPISFAPTGTANGTVNGSVVLTDNSLNATNATQTIALGGTALLPVPTQLVFTTPPTVNIAPEGNAGTVVVSEEDGSGDLASASTDTISLTVTGPSSYSQTYTQTASGGVATFNLSSVALNTPGAYTYAATFSGLATATATETVVGTSYTAPTISTGTPSGVQTATILFSSQYTLNTTLATAIQVLTLGAPNLDFAYASGGTCAAGTTYSAGQSCTVNYTFTPRYPGPRYGAVELVDGSSNVLATAYINGVGTGPQINFSPGTVSTLASGSFYRPSDVAVDGSGNVFIADTSNNAVKEIVKQSGQVISLANGNFNNPYSVAVDGAGNVFVADTFNYAVKEILAAGGYTTVNTLAGDTGNFSYSYGVAVDGSGNVFVADSGHNLVKEILAAGGYTTVTTLAVDNGNFNNPWGVAVDGSGNVFVADIFHNAIKEILAAGGYTTVNTLAVDNGNFHSPWGVAVDGSGNVFVADSSNNAVKEILAAGGYTTVNTLAVAYGEFFGPGGVAVDGSGNVFVADKWHDAIKEIDLADAPSLSFATTAVGVRSADSPQTVVVVNGGNQPLNFYSVGVPSDFPLDSTGGTVCSSASPLAASATCTLPINFTPAQIGSSLSESLALADNNLNAVGSSPALQRIWLSGTANAPAITFSSPVSTTLTSGKVGVPYSVSFTATGGAGPYIYSGTVPAGLTLSSSGSLSGTPTTAVTSHSITVTATDANNFTGQQTFYLTIGKGTATINITPYSVPYDGNAHSATGSATGSGSVNLSGDLDLSGTTHTNAGSYTSDAWSFTDPTGNYAYTSGTVSDTITMLTATATAPSATNFSSIILGSTTTQTVTFIIQTAGVIGVPVVVTEGATNMDFTDVGDGTCTTANGSGNGYSALATCTVDVRFRPRYPGQRMGAVLLEDTSNNILATAYVYGVGIGSEVTFASVSGGNYAPSAINTLGSGFTIPAGVAVDASGNVYVADNGSSQVMEIMASGGLIPASPTINILGSGFNAPHGVAVDGSGNVYVADTGNGAIKEILAVNGGIPVSPTINTLGSGFSGPYGVAVDGSGNVYVADTGNGLVKEILAVNGVIPATPTINTLGSGFIGPTGVAVDGSGNVFVSDPSIYGNGQVKEIVAVGGVIPSTNPTIRTLGSGFYWPQQLAVDGNGNVYVADSGNRLLMEIMAVGGVIPDSPTIITLGSGFLAPVSVAVNGSGNVYIADGGNGGTNTVSELTYATPPTLNFATTAVGLTSTDSPRTVTVTNEGNASLNFSSLSIPADFPLASSGEDVCSSSTMLGVNASCMLPINFKPTVTTSLSERLTLTDNSLNFRPPEVGSLKGPQPLMNPNSNSQSILLNGTGFAPTITFTLPASTTLSAGTVGVSYSGASFTATGGTAPYSYSGTVPAGLTLSNSGSLSGTPTTEVTSYSITVTATDANHFTGSQGYTLTINQGTATVTLGSLAQTYTGSALSATATTNPTGLTVNFTYNSSSTAPTAAGSYTVVGTISDSNYHGSNTGTLLIGKATPTVSASAWPTASAITYGQTLASSTLTGGTGSVAGSFAFTTPTTTPGVGIAAQSVTFTPADSTDYSSVTGTVSVTVNKATPTASVTSNSNPALVQNAATFTATVSSQAGTPTGTVTFLDGTTPLGTGTLSGGLAMLTTSALTAGTHSISVIYGGDTNFAAANSSALTQTVLDFSLIGGSGNGSSGTTQIVLSGGIATYALAFQSGAGALLPLPVTLTVSGMPAGAVATVTPSSWTQLTSTSWSFPANTALTNISLSIQLPSTMSSLNQKDLSGRKLPLVFLSIFLLPFAGRMRRTGRILSRMLSMLLLLIAGMTALAGLSGCGSSTGFFAQARQSYTVTATVTSGTLSHSTTMTLTVE